MPSFAFLVFIRLRFEVSRRFYHRIERFIHAPEAVARFICSFLKDLNTKICKQIFRFFVLRIVPAIYHVSNKVAGCSFGYILVTLFAWAISILFVIIACIYRRSHVLIILAKETISF